MEGGVGRTRTLRCRPPSGCSEATSELRTTWLRLTIGPGKDTGQVTDHIKLQMDVCFVNVQRRRRKLYRQFNSTIRPAQSDPTVQLVIHADTCPDPNSRIVIPQRQCVPHSDTEEALTLSGHSRLRVN